MSFYKNSFVVSPPKDIRALPSLRREGDLGDLLRKSHPPPQSSALSTQLLRQSAHPKLIAKITKILSTPFELVRRLARPHNSGWRQMIRGKASIICSGYDGKQRRPILPSLFS